MTLYSLDTVTRTDCRYARVVTPRLGDRIPSIRRTSEDLRPCDDAQCFSHACPCLCVWRWSQQSVVGCFVVKSLCGSSQIGFRGNGKPLARQALAPMRVAAL